MAVMGESGEYKQCPACAEDIKAKAIICRYCRMHVSQNKDAKDGKFVRIKLKAFENIYHGDIYIVNLNGRVSDVVNDDRKFISIINTTREAELDEIEIGYMAINKSVIEWVCMEKDGADEQEDGPIIGHSIY